MLRSVLFGLVFLPALTGQAATISVTTLVDEIDDNGACSLREAILAANNAPVPPSGCVAGGSGSVDTILIPAGVYTLSIVGSGEDSAATGDLDIADSLVIEGADAANTIIDAGGTLGDRVFDLVGGNLSLTLRKLTIRGGRAPNGSGNMGGGIRLSQSTSALIVDRCVVTANASGNGTSAGGHGGGIFSASNKLLIVDSSISANTAGNGECASGGGQAGQGAGAFLSGGLIVRSTFADNVGGTTTGCSPSILSMGVGVLNFGSPLTVEDSHFANNGQAHDGGAINAYQGLTIRRSSFVGNTSLRGGSAVYASFGTNLIENSTFSGNTNAQNGGAIQYNQGAEMRVSHSTIVNNTGGGLAQVNSGTFTARNCLVADNVSITSTPLDCSGIAAIPSSAGFNLFRQGGGCIADPVLQDAAVPSALGVLVEASLSTAANGTRFHAPLASSQLIDRGTCTTTSAGYVGGDQRNLPRECGCDVGAIEFQRSPVVVSDEGEGLNCPRGGKRIETVDCTGAVQQTSFVCVPEVTTGPSGPVGPSGNNGADGVAGPTGAVGPSGPQGDAGPSGPQGDAGPSGPQGEVGPAGAAVEGPRGPAGPRGCASAGSGASLFAEGVAVGAVLRWRKRRAKI